MRIDYFLKSKCKTRNPALKVIPKCPKKKSECRQKSGQLVFQGNTPVSRRFTLKFVQKKYLYAIHCFKFLSIADFSQL
jgi:hypothetical protein